MCASQVAYCTVHTNTRTHGNDYELLNRYLITQYVSGPAKGTRYVFRTPPPPRDPVLSRNEGVTRSWGGTQAMDQPTHGRGRALALLRPREVEDIPNLAPFIASSPLHCLCPTWFTTNQLKSDVTDGIQGLLDNTNAEGEISRDGRA